MASSPPSSPISPLGSPTNLPTQTYHHSILPRSIPTASMLDSAVGGAHYSGVESVNERRRSVRRHSQSLNANENGAAGHGAALSRRRSSVVPEPNPFHLTVLDDLKDVCDSLYLFWVFFFSRVVRCTKVSRRRKCFRSGGGRMRNTRCVVPPVGPMNRPPLFTRWAHAGSIHEV
jgi:hypothetical protein